MKPAVAAAETLYTTFLVDCVIFIQAAAAAAEQSSNKDTVTCCGRWEGRDWRWEASGCLVTPSGTPSLHPLTGFNLQKLLNFLKIGKNTENEKKTYKKNQIE